MRTLLLVVGFLALAIGLLWIGQGTGVIKWPESSFMISQIQWAGYGAALAVVGLVLIWQSTALMAGAPMTLFDLAGKVAIVTGGNGGIGLGMARGLAEAGAAVAIVGAQ